MSHKNHRRLGNGWVEEADGSRALVIDAKTWAAYEQAANAKGKTAYQVITTDVAEALLTILLDNYVPNRLGHAHAPESPRLNVKPKGH